MSINERSVTTVRSDVTGNTTTEGNFQIGLDDVITELNSMQIAIFGDGEDPADYNTGNNPVTIASLRGLTANADDINLLTDLGNTSLTPHLDTAQLGLLSTLNTTGTDIAYMGVLNGVDSTLTGEELNFLDGIGAVGGTAASTDDPTIEVGNATATLDTTDIIKLAGWGGTVNDLHKLTAISANAGELNVLDGVDSNLVVGEINTLVGIDTNTTVQAQLDTKIDVSDFTAGDGIDIDVTMSGDASHPQVSVAVAYGAGLDVLADASAANNDGNTLVHAIPSTVPDNITEETMANRFEAVSGLSWDTFGHTTVADTKVLTTTAPLAISTAGAMTIANASATASGVVTTGAQTFAGAKTFSSTIVGSISGSAATWTTGRTITLTGDVTGTSGTFNGSDNLSFAASLAANSVDSDQYVDGSIDHVHLANNIIDNDNLINTASFTAVNFTATSDERLKSDISTIDNALNKVQAMRGVEYTMYDRDGVGVIAQEVEKVIPQVVHTDDEGMKSVAYGHMVGVLIEAIKELRAEVEELKYGTSN